ncbi:hypothetical protein, partial [Scytonema sp. NUACC21]
PPPNHARVAFHAAAPLRLNKNSKGVEVDLCNTLYKYVKNLVDKCEQKVENWRNIAEWLEDAGYKTPSSNQFKLSDDVPVELLVKKANISFESNKIIVDINLRIVTASPSEVLTIENFDINNGKG